MKNINTKKAVRHTSFPNSRGDNKNISAWVSPAVRAVFHEVAKKEYHVSPSTLLRVVAESLIKREITINSRTTPSELDVGVIANINVNSMPEKTMAYDEVAKLFPVEEDYPTKKQFILEGIKEAGGANSYDRIMVVSDEDTGKVFSVALHENDYANETYNKTPYTTFYFGSDGQRVARINGEHEELYVAKGIERLCREIYLIDNSSSASYTASLTHSTIEYCVDLINDVNCLDLSQG